MRKTLLEIVQDILNDIGADKVDSISDTVESEQVASVVRSCFENMIANRNWLIHRQFRQLDESGSLDLPNYLKIPANTKELSDFRYDKGTTTKRFEAVTYKDPVAFLNYVNNRNSSNSNVETVVDPSGAELLILNDVPPTYWTSFDDTYIVTDSYNSDVDDTLKASKTQVLMYILPEWVHEDSAIPALPDEAFPSLIEEAKSTAFLVVKEVVNQKAENNSNKQRMWLSRKQWQLKGGITYPDYGRKR